jgi:predicted AlkP superfamily phosphohydrolase/phosphomutase
VKDPVIAIGLDAADPLLLERWMDAGQLPQLAQLRRDGAYTRLANFEYCRAEAACTAFLTGCPPWQTGRWAPFKFHTDYTVDDRQAYEFDEYPPFYALGPDYRVTMFDLPQTRLHAAVNGIQVLGWGAHSPRTTRTSEPRGLLDDLTARHGTHPTYEKDHVVLWDTKGMQWLKNGLITGIERRASICAELVRRDAWDLFLTYFGETHSAGHFFWHLSQPDHPLYEAGSADVLLGVFQAVDRALAQIIRAAPPNARVVIFSDHGMEANSTDLPSLVFLPEALYRWSFPGKRGLAAGRPGVAPPPARPRVGRAWTHEVWALKHDPNPVTRFMRRSLPVEFFHYAIERRLGINGVPLCPEDCRLGHQPPMWYRPAWGEMKAFALPSFSEGYVRINLRGREHGGIVSPSDYSAVCDEVEALLGGIRDARTGAPMVDNVLRTRRTPLDDDPKLPDPDLVIRWTARPTDIVDTSFGRIGPVPFQRTGSHVERGFLLAAGRGVGLRRAAGEPHALDLAPTILSLLGAPVPPYMQGQPLLEDAAAVAGPSIATASTVTAPA